MDELRYLFPTFTIGEAATATIVTADPEGDYYGSFRNWAAARQLCMIPIPHVSQFNGPEPLPGVEPLKFFSYGRELLDAAVDYVLGRDR